MNILSLFPAVPLVMMLGLWLSKSTRQIHTVMVAGSSLLVALAVVLVVQYLGLRGAGETAQMLFTESRVWYAPLNIHYAVGVDGISVAMLLLSAVIVFTGTFASWQMKTDVKAYFLWFCLLSVGVFGFFISVDLFTMFLFYEVALIPMYLLIGVWGSGRKEYAAMKLTLMLMGGSALLLIGILGIYFGAGATTMNIQEIAALNNTTISDVFATGGTVALSKVLPNTVTGSTNVNMDAAIATLLGADYTKAGYLGEFMAVRLMPMRDVIIPGTQNTTVETMLSENDIWMLAGNGRKPLTIGYTSGTPISIEMDPTRTGDFEIGLNLTIALDSVATFASKIAHFTV